MTAIVWLLDSFPEFAGHAFLVFLRVGAAIFMLPVFGETMVPMRVRLGLALAFTAVVAPLLLPQVQVAVPDGPSVSAGFAELLVGLAIGFALRLQIMALQVAASLAAQATSLSQLLGGDSVDPQPALGVILLLAALALATALGLHVQVAAMFVRSYALVPAGTFVAATDLSAWAIAAVAECFNLAMVLALPFVAVSLLYNLALGVINKAMPQLMVAFVGAPAITYGALLLLFLSAPILLSVWIEALELRLFSPFGAR